MFQFFLELLSLIFSGLMLCYSIKFDSADSAAVFGMWFGSSLSLLILMIVDWFYDRRQ